jgi:hypothetical protein
MPYRHKLNETLLAIVSFQYMMLLLFYLQFINRSQAFMYVPILPLIYLPFSIMIIVIVLIRKGQAWFRQELKWSTIILLILFFVSCIILFKWISSQF